MPEAFAHDATLVMPLDADLRAPGAAVTLALCGSWDHVPPCPLAPHHTAVERTDTQDSQAGRGSQVVLRILFSVEPDREAEVRLRIREALAGERLQSPEGVLTRWELLSNGPGVLRPQETEHAQRLVDSG